MLIEVGNTDYIVNEQENKIAIITYVLGRNYSNNVRTIYKAIGKKSVAITDINDGWATGGMGMSAIRERKIVNQRLHDLIIQTIQKLQEIEKETIDENEKWERKAEILQEFENETQYCFD